MPSRVTHIEGMEAKDITRQSRRLTLEVPMPALLLLASLMNLTASEAIALPTVVEVACAKAGMGRDELVHNCIGNVALREYLANACRVGAEAL